MFFSKYIHFLQLNAKTIAAFNSLTLEAFYFELEELKHIKDTLECQSAAIDNKSIQLLINKNFIIKKKDDDVNFFNEHASLVNPIVLANALIVITETCNLSCKYCFINTALHSKRKEKNMRADYGSTVVAQLQSIFERQKKFTHHKTITFYGGEPLLNLKAIKSIVTEVQKVQKTKFWPQNISYNIITNATLLTESTIIYLKENRIALGISYDGNSPSNKSRVYPDGSDSLNIVLTKLALCREMYLPFSLSVTITKEFLDDQDKQLDHLISINPNSITFNPLIPQKSTPISEEYYSDYADFLIKAFKVLRELGIRENRMMGYVEHFITRTPCNSNCVAIGGNQCIITPSGEFGICQGFLNDRCYFSKESINNKEFHYEESESFQLWHKRMGLHIKECSVCDSLGICGGGCAYESYMLSGDIFTLNTSFCIVPKKILRWLLEEQLELITYT